jgi:hypothetical protein
VAVNDPRFPSRHFGGDVAINDDGSATAIWSVASLTNDRFTDKIWRSTKPSSRAWTPPRRIARNALIGSGALESTPAGFTAITWVNARRRTVVDLRPADGLWSRQIVPRVHGHLAVGPRETVVLLRSIFDESSGRPHGLRVTWRSNRSDWTTTRLASPRAVVFPLQPAVDRTGRIFVPWRQLPRGRPPERALMSTFSGAWATTILWDRAWPAEFTAADVSRNGRAVAIRTVTNAEYSSTTVLMRVLGPT